MAPIPTLRRLLTALLVLLGLLAVVPQASAWQLWTKEIVEVEYNCEPEPDGGRVCDVGACFRFDPSGGLLSPTPGVKPDPIRVWFPGVGLGGPGIVPGTGIEDGTYRAGYGGDC